MAASITRDHNVTFHTNKSKPYRKEGKEREDRQEEKRSHPFQGNRYKTDSQTSISQSKATKKIIMPSSFALFWDASGTPQSLGKLPVKFIAPLHHPWCTFTSPNTDQSHPRTVFSEPCLQYIKIIYFRKEHKYHYMDHQVPILSPVQMQIPEQQQENTILLLNGLHWIYHEVSSSSCLLGKFTPGFLTCKHGLQHF